jgi:hypothetical protein
MECALTRNCQTFNLKPSEWPGRELIAGAAISRGAKQQHANGRADKYGSSTILGQIDRRVVFACTSA